MVSIGRLNSNMEQFQTKNIQEPKIAPKQDTITKIEPITIVINNNEDGTQEVQFLMANGDNW